MKIEIRQARNGGTETYILNGLVAYKQKWEKKIGRHRAKRKKYTQAIKEITNPQVKEEAIKQRNAVKRKIDGIAQQIKRLDKIYRRLLVLQKFAEEFTDESVNKQGSMARKLFCKYAIENITGGGKTSLFLGLNPRGGAHQNRMDFSRSFKKNPSNLATWRRFKDYIKDEDI